MPAKSQTNIARDVVVVGGGAAGYFAAIAVATVAPDLSVSILEGSKSPLGKVRISGGGRCNVTHDCSEPHTLVRSYPRGGQELLGPFHRFGTRDTMDWFEQRGVELKVESDGRVFPVSDDSGTIVDALTEAADELGVQQLLRHRVTDIAAGPDGRWRVTSGNGSVFDAAAVVVCSGSNSQIWRALGSLGLEIVPSVPSLFTFDARDTRLRQLAGVSVANAMVAVVAADISASGPLLITHRGLSGPAILRLSAWGARQLAAFEYQFEVSVNWLGDCGTQRALNDLNDARARLSRKKILGNCPFDLPASLYRNIAKHAGIPDEKRWADLSREEARRLAKLLTESVIKVSGKSTNKDEFVTAGGVALKAIDFRNFSARGFPGLFLAGEVLDIDAITGGFNFQAAWTGGWLAGHAVGGRFLTL